MAYILVHTGHMLEVTEENHGNLTHESRSLRQIRTRSLPKATCVSMNMKEGCHFRS